ncbi:MAG: glycosyltransferase family 2 protein [Ignavibacteriaceae bacterium]|nr:glycosyltransferase family 2 protein [Ignavibacteriaceae bacterium]
MRTNPLVSVIIPVHNAEKYLAESINSALGQDYSATELIVVTDNCSDDSEKVAAEIAERDKRVKVFNPGGLGSAAKARNYGIKRANGDVIAFLDADDRWRPGKLTRQVPVLINERSAALVYSVSRAFGETGFFSAAYEVLPLPWKIVKSHKDLLEKGNSIPCSSVIVKKELLKKAGGFDENPENQSEDYDLWLKLTQFGDAKFVPIPAVDYRIHAEQYSSDATRREERLKYIERKWGIKINYSEENRSNPVKRVLRALILRLVSAAYSAGLIRGN